jgi:hypothetical protein
MWEIPRNNKAIIRSIRFIWIRDQRYIGQSSWNWGVFILGNEIFSSGKGLRGEGVLATNTLKPMTMISCETVER